MTAKNERMRAALREIENRAAAALANQPEGDAENTRHLTCALAEIGRIMRGTENGEIGWVSHPESPNGEAEAVRNAVGREAVAQGGDVLEYLGLNPRRGPRRQSLRSCNPHNRHG